MKQIYIQKNEKSISDYLIKNYPMLKTGMLNKFMRTNKIKLNGKKLPLNTPMVKGDILNLYIDDMYFEKPDRDNAFRFSGKNIEIVYEDDNLIAVNKPAGIPVSDDDWKNYDTLINRVKNHYFNLGLNTTPALCHRLDTGTQGLVLIAKNNEFLRFMLDVFRNKDLEKEYICIVKGIPRQKKALHSAWLTKNSKQAYVTVSEKSRGNLSKPIQTHVTLIDSYNDYSLLRIGLVTGRTHQIRAHLAYLGMPVLGDSRYGINSLNRQLKLKYQTLCSYRIKFGPISDSRYSYLSGKEIACPDPWFVDSFYKREF